MGTFLGQALKSRLGDREWIDFFAIVSSAFAYREGCVAVPRFAHLSREETCAEVALAEKRTNALDRMKGLSVAADAITKSKVNKGWFYHLIILDSLKRRVRIRGYDRESVDQAVRDYSKIEAAAARGMKIEPVLVSAGPLDGLRRAYPNFFLDIDEFMGLVREIVSAKKET